LWQSLKQDLLFSNAYLIITAILLIPDNWYFESRKWKLLTLPFEPTSLKQAISSILCGITLAIITPNRIGEYGGRVIFLKPENKGKGLVANFVASLSQNSLNISIGFLGAILFYDLIYDIIPWTKSVLIFIWLTLSFLMFLVYYQIDVLRKLFRTLRKFSLTNKIYKNLKLVKLYRSNDLSSVMVFSLFRFTIYLVQYVLILKFFGITAPLLTMFLGVATIYFIQTGVPLPPLLGILARGEIALLVWSFFAQNDLSILAATYTLWILNLVIPALIGLILLFKTNLIKSFGYDKQRLDLP
jgi:hypothetical protein